jgi:hypothetical protein
MEMFGIMLFSAVGLIAAPAFCVLVENVLGRFRKISLVIWALSVVIVTAFIFKSILVWSVGPVRIRTTIGPAYWYLHVIMFLLVAPSLSCALLLLKRYKKFGWWWVGAAPICWFIGVYAILLQYHVFETLYGVEGSGGPFKPPY